MVIIRTILQIAILWGYFWLGQLIVQWTGIFIPASIIGLLLLLISLLTGILDVRFIKDGASFLIAFLTLFFIPATIGVIEYPELLTIQGVILLIAVVLSTVIAIFVTGKCSQWIERKEQAKKGGI